MEQWTFALFPADSLHATMLRIMIFPAAFSNPNPVRITPSAKKQFQLDKA